MSILRNRKVVLIVATLILTSVLVVIFYYLRLQNSREFLTVVFLDVGQGDSIFIESPNGNQVLIDSGPGSAAIRQVAKFIPFFDRQINLAIATHFDADHVSGFTKLFDKYKFEQFAASDFETDDVLRSEIYNLADTQKIDQLFLYAGDKIILDFEHEIFLEILWPPKNATEFNIDNKNDSSISARLVYGETEFMLTGDLSGEYEKIIVSNIEAENLQSNILKAGHHGSKTSTSKEFLEATKPDYLIVSAGLDNKFGHPDQSVVERAESEKIKILQTAELGSIVFQSNGKEAWIK